MANGYPYNPYNAYKKIVGYKGDWHTSKQLGGDPDQYYQAAVPYYQELYDNGHGDLADDLAASDYITAKGLLDKYGLKPDNQFNTDYNMNALTGGYDTGDKTDDKLLGAATGTNDRYDELMKTATGIATGQSAPSLSPTVQNLYDSWLADNDRLNGEIKYDSNGNVVSGLNTEHYNIGRNQLDYINNFDVTAQPYYQGIMDQYKLGGQNAAANAYANGAASNGGNIDSYAAANANRQQLAFTTAGQQAALAAAQQNASNWQTLYSQMSEDLANQGAISADTLKTAANIYATDANERMNALDVQGAMEQTAMSNAINAYLGKIAEDTQRYGIDAETAMNTENNRAALEQLIASITSQERMNTENNQTTRYGYDTEKAIQEGVNATNRYTSDNSLRGTMYQTDAQRDIAAMGNTASMNELMAKIQGELSLADLNNQATYDQLLAQIAGQKELAAYDRDTQIKLAKNELNNTIAMKEAEYELAQKYGITLDSSGNVSSGNQSDIGGADVLRYVTQAWKDYKGDQKYFKSLEEVYDAVARYDMDQYGGEYKKVYTDYLNQMYKYANKGDYTAVAVSEGMDEALNGQ